MRDGKAEGAQVLAPDTGLFYAHVRKNVSTPIDAGQMGGGEGDPQPV